MVSVRCVWLVCVVSVCVSYMARSQFGNEDVVMYRSDIR